MLRRYLRPLLGASLVVCVVGVVFATDPAALRRDANAAYESEDYARGARYFALAAAATSGAAAATDYYNAACCHALAGNVDAAFEMLERAVLAGYTDRGHISADTDLAALREDTRWEALLERIVEPEIVITDNLRHAADEAEFVFTDVHNFVRAMQLVGAGAELVPTLETEYFARATPGLLQMVRKYPFTAEDLAEAIARYPEKYGRIARNVELLEARQQEFRAAYRRYEEFAPDIVFPPTYFLVDRHRGIGSGSPDGQLISIETRTGESIARIETLLIHELTHFQQLVAAGSDEFYALFGPKKSLLGLTIREGAAEFIAERITNRMTQEDARDYVVDHEQQVWQRFRSQMMSDDTTDWMWSDPHDPDQPRDVAYVLGARIVEAYYEHAPDKRKAMQEIFSVVDYAAFLERSGYMAE
jgi:tetratricopeptide (TPR) repeat protein